MHLLFSLTFWTRQGLEELGYEQSEALPSPERHTTEGGEVAKGAIPVNDSSQYCAINVQVKCRAHLPSDDMTDVHGVIINNRREVISRK